MPDIIYRYRDNRTGRYVYINEDQLGRYPDAIVYMSTGDGGKQDLGTVRSLGMAYGDYEPDLTTEQRFNRLGIFFNEDTRTWQNGDGRIRISAPRTTTQRVSTSSEPTYEQRLIAIGYGLNPQTGRLEPPRLTNVAKRQVITSTSEPVATPDLTQVAAAREIIDSELNGVGPYGGRITEEESVQALMPDTSAAVQAAQEGWSPQRLTDVGKWTPSVDQVEEAIGDNPLQIPDYSNAYQAIEENLNATSRETSLPEGRVEDVITGSVREYDPAFDLPSGTVMRPNPHPSEPIVDDSIQTALDVARDFAAMAPQGAVVVQEQPTQRAIGSSGKSVGQEIAEEVQQAYMLPSQRATANTAEERATQDAWRKRAETEAALKEMSEIWKENPNLSEGEVRAIYMQRSMKRSQQQQNKPTSQNIIQRVGESIASVLSPASANATALVDSNQSVYDLGEVLSGQTVPGAKGKYVYYKNYPNLRGYAYANLEGLNPEFATRLGNFSNWYKENIGREFYGSSGYRDTEHQGKVRATQGKAAANPGYSYHGSGTAFDADWIAALSATKKAIRNNPNLLTEYNVSNEVELLDKALAQYGLERNMKDNPREQHHIQAIEDDAWMKAVNTELLLEHYKNGLLGTQLGSYYMRRRI